MYSANFPSIDSLHSIPSHPYNLHRFYLIPGNWYCWTMHHQSTKKAPHSCYLPSSVQDQKRSDLYQPPVHRVKHKMTDKSSSCAAQHLSAKLPALNSPSFFPGMHNVKLIVVHINFMHFSHWYIFPWFKFPYLLSISLSTILLTLKAKEFRFYFQIYRLTVFIVYTLFVVKLHWTALAYHRIWSG